jgi:hypothetical protein
MKKNEDRGRAPAPRLIRLLCRRTGQQIEPREHERCPYCFGKLAEIETGRHEAFCGYRPGIDPLSFGFPGDDVRVERG